MKKIIAIFSVMLLLSATVKIAFLNMNAERPNIQKYRENFPADPFICRGFRWIIWHSFVCRFRIYRDAYLSGLRRSEISTSYIGTDDIYRRPFGSVPWLLPGFF